MARTPLARPQLPDDFAPVRLSPLTVGIAGRDAATFAAALADALRALDRAPRCVELTLRHAEGYTKEEGRVVAHADALEDALRSIEARPLLGVGDAFAQGVACDLRIGIGLPPRGAGAFRPRPSDLLLREPRPGLVAPLALVLARRS